MTASSPLRVGLIADLLEEGWPSMMVVLELEREFGTRIPTARLPELLDVDSIARVLALDTR